ncbi:MAG: hypothetical protein LBH87_03675, partial [Coriobacteriales bacterium]|nr:hypothetical protein [Coriobacteriales bacterium]
MGECLTYPMLQKFYSAVRNANNIGVECDLFDGISTLDAFFSEFRSITFVMQKSFSSPQDRLYYEEKRNAYLMNDLMKWFNEKRVSTVHNEPFKLEKCVLVDLYDECGKTTVIDDRFILENDSDIESLIDTLSDV